MQDALEEAGGWPGAQGPDLLSLRIVGSLARGALLRGLGFALYIWPGLHALL